MNVRKKVAARFLLGLIFCLLVVGCATEASMVSHVDWPKIIAVQAWGGTAADSTNQKRHRITHITLHHGGVAFLRDKDPAAYLRNLQTWSRKTRLWSDIPYHYLIDLDGKIYEGRDVNFAGDTNTQYDPTGHALIVVLGNFEEVAPNPAQLEAVVTMMTALARTYRVPLENIAGHKDYSTETECPGKSLYPYLKEGTFQRQVAERMKVTP
jgi:N-acetylmuramoyl-L-alanine amidase